jgi:hypothetical protein
VVEPLGRRAGEPRDSVAQGVLASARNIDKASGCGEEKA